MLRRKTRRDRMCATLKAIKEKLRRRWHHSIPEQGKWLRQVVQGYFKYHAVPTNSSAMYAFRSHVHRSKATRLAAPEPAGRYDVGENEPLGQGLVATSSDPSSLASRAIHRQIPKAGARCANCARRDLRGGCPAMGIPTVTSTAGDQSLFGKRASWE